MTEKVWHNLELEEIKEILKTNLEKGLSEREIKIRQKQFGRNLLPREKPLSTLKIFLEQFKSSLIYILVIAGFLCLFLRDFTDAIIIFSAVFLNTIIGFIQENKTSKILSELKKIVKVKALVIREGNEKEIEQSELVPGDIILLHPGNKVPADGRLIESHNLKINESSLTGEWMPAEKKIQILPKETPLANRDNMVYMGSIVEEGRGKAIITGTGLNTEIGKVAILIKEVKEEKTPYQKKVIRLSRNLAFLVLFISLLIFFLGIIKEKEIELMFLTAIAVAVAAIPEGLPVGITVIFAIGMERILRRQGLVRKMISVETLGNTSIIATDKTGTLTEAKMMVSGVFIPNQIFEKEQKTKDEIHLLTLKIATLCSEAFIENLEAPLKEWILRGRATDKALLLAGIQAGLNKKILEKEEIEIEKLPFDSINKYSANLRKFSEKENILYVLGAPEKILEMSKYFDINEKTEILSKENINQLKKKIEELAEKGERVLATGYKKIETERKYEKLEELSKDLIFTGLISLNDSLRPEVKEAIKICQEAGMKPIIVTGDHKLTAKTITKELGLPAKEENIIEGKDLDFLSDEEFQKKLKDIEIYVRVEPRHKIRIIQAWQKRGEVVAMTGDGINDAPALKRANIGVALGSGTDVAKEASDLILLTDNFSIIIAAIEEGRQIIDNIRKVISYLLCTSWAQITLISCSILANLPLPILPGQILWINLIEDGPPAMSLAFEPKERGLMKRKPENPKISLLTKEMKILIFLILIFTIFFLISLFLWLLNQNLAERKIQTMMFAGITIMSLFYAFSCKNLKENIWKINLFLNLKLIISLLFGILMLSLAIYLPLFQNLLRTLPLNFSDWGLLLGLGFLNLILIEIGKWYFIVKRKLW